MTIQSGTLELTDVRIGGTQITKIVDGESGLTIWQPGGGPPAGGSPVFVQQASAGNQGGGNNYKATPSLDAKATAGNTLLFYVRMYDNTDVVSGLPANAQLVATILPDGSSRPIKVYKLYPTAGTEQTFNLVWSVTASAANHAAAVQEWVGNVNFSNGNGKYVYPFWANAGLTWAFGPSLAPPDANALPVAFGYHDNTNHGDVSWSSGWNGVGWAANATNHWNADVAYMATPPGGSAAGSWTFTSLGNAAAYLYWMMGWVTKAQ